jgi:hypothetical protein
MSYAWKDDGTGFIGKDSLGRIDFDGNNSTIYSANYKNNQGMMIDLGGDSTPYIDMKNGLNKYVKTGFTTDNDPYLEIKSANNTIRFNSTDSGSKIELKNGSNAIIINSNSNTNPLSIGSKFHVKWDGSIKSTSGNIGGWAIDETTLSCKNDKVVLNSNGTISGAIIEAGTL